MTEQTKKSTSDTFIPIARAWGQPNPSSPTAKQQCHNSNTTISRWLSEPQREQPWNAVGSVPARPFGPGTGENGVEGSEDIKKDSEHATRGRTSSANVDVLCYFCEAVGERWHADK